MSTASIVDLHALPRPEREREPERHLRALPLSVPRKAPRLVHGVIALVGIGGIVAAQLGLSVVVSEGAYELSALQAQSTDLSRQQQTLSEGVAVLESPQHVAIAADDLGMLAGQPSQFLTLSGTATAGGPDALHMQVPALDQFGMYVPNALLAEQPDTAAAVQAALADAARPYPGMLLPAGEAAFAEADAAAPAVAEQPAPGTLLPPTAED